MILSESQQKDIETLEYQKSLAIKLESYKNMGMCNDKQYNETGLSISEAIKPLEVKYGLVEKRKGLNELFSLCEQKLTEIEQEIGVLGIEKETLKSQVRHLKFFGGLFDDSEQAYQRIFNEDFDRQVHEAIEQI